MVYAAVPCMLIYGYGHGLAQTITKAYTLKWGPEHMINMAWYVQYYMVVNHINPWSAVYGMQQLNPYYILDFFFHFYCMCYIYWAYP